VEVPADIIDLIQEGIPEKVNGIVYSVPVQVQLKADVFYNKTIFAENNIELPTTWEEFKQICEQLHNNGVVPFVTAGPSSGFYTSFLWSNAMLTKYLYNMDTNYMELLYTGKMKWNDPGIVKVSEDWMSLVNAGYYHKGSNSFTREQAENEFLSGSAAMIANGSWFAMQADVSEIDVGYLPIPYPNTSDYYINANEGETAVAASSEHPEEAFTFIKFLLEDDEAYRVFLEATTGISSRVKPLEYEVGKTANEIRETTKDLKMIINMLDHPGEFKLPPGMIQEVHRAGRNMFAGADIQATLTELDEIYRELIEQHSK
jgi:raffinose/stachyose/melibiose transport system substrate-binding protein